MNYQNNYLAPICLFVYNRLNETKQTVEALLKNNLAKESELFIFSDGAKKIEEQYKIDAVRKYLNTIIGFKKITIKKSPQNKGLANSIIDGVTEIINLYGKVIVLEDDLITTPNFLDFMNQALIFYKSNDKIMSVNGYSLRVDKKNDLKLESVYFQNRPFPWGWGTWKEKWAKEFFFDKKLIKKAIQNKKTLNNQLGNDISKMLYRNIMGKNNSWYILYTIQHFYQNKLSVYPYKSKVINIGFSQNSTNCNSINTYIHDLDKSKSNEFCFIENVNISNFLKKKFLKYFSRKHKIIFRLKLLLKRGGWYLVFKEFKNRLLK